jgi:hypothetical protein
MTARPRTFSNAAQIAPRAARIRKTAAASRLLSIVSS